MNQIHYKLLLKRLLLLVVIYSFCRILFYLLNINKFLDASFLNLFLSFVYGLRFDLSAIAGINIFFIFFSLLPFHFLSNNNYQRFLKGLFLATNIPPIFINLIDIEYFKFTGRRTNYEIVKMSQDILDQAPQLTLYYWYIPLLGILFTYLIVKYYPRYKHGEHPVKIIPAIGFLILGMGLTIFAFRGGMQLKPLRPNHAFVLTPNVLGNLILNTPFTIIGSYTTAGIEKVNFYNSTEDLFANIPHPKLSRHNFHSNGKENIVIIILESFSSEYLGFGNNYKGYTPFLDSLAAKSWFYKNNFANARSSMEGLPAVIASIPNLMREPYITSVYQTNKIQGLGTVLAKNGYHTSFFHGGKNGTMGFDVFSHNAGFENYFGLNEYEGAHEDNDGSWGIYDEPFLQFFSKKISGFPQPFLTAVFTLSSHQPFKVPEKYKHKFPKGNMEIHRTIGYTDYALKTFFEQAQKQSWYKNTLFIITADHTIGMRNTPLYSNTIGDYQIPLIIFHPRMKEGKIINGKITEQVDVMPTVLDYLKIPYTNNRILFGQSALDTTNTGVAVNYLDGNYQLIHSDYFLELAGNESKLYKYSDRQMQNLIIDEPAIKEKYEHELKAYIQYYNNGLIDNSWIK